MGEDVPSGAQILAVEIKQLLDAGRHDLPAVAGVFQQNVDQLQQDFDYILMRTDGVGLGATGAYPQWSALRDFLVRNSERMHEQLEVIGETLVEVAHDLARSDSEIQDAFTQLRREGIQPGADRKG